MANKKDSDLRVQDIPHEEVNITLPDANGKLATLPVRILTPEEIAEQEIKKFNLADSAIEILKQKYGSLIISGPEDKAGYKAVREAWANVRSKRTGLEKKGKELRDGYNLISKKIIKEEGRLIELLTPLEISLHEKWKAIDEEKERAEKEKEAAEQAELMARIESLQKLGMVLDGGFYSIGGVLTVDVVTLRSMPEDQFLRLKTKAQAIFDQEQAEIKKREEERRRESEAYEIAKQELLAQQAAMKELQEKIQRDRDELEKQRKAAEAQVLEGRVNKFLGLGMVRGSGELLFSIPGIVTIDVFIEPLREMSEAMFNEQYEEVVSQIKEAIDKKEKKEIEEKEESKAREQKEKFIAEQMEGAGMKYNYSFKKFEAKVGDFYFSTDFNQMFPLTDEEILSRAADIKTEIQKAKLSAENEERQRVEEEEKQRRLGMKDDELFEGVLADVISLAKHVNNHNFKTKKFTAIRYELVCLLEDFYKKYKK